MRRGSDTVDHKRLRWIVLPVALAVGLAICLITFGSKPADAASSLTLEAEKMQGSGTVFSDGAASMNRGRLFKKNRSASKSFSSSVDSLRIRARGDSCGGAARMVVSLDGRKVMSRLVSTKRWNSYSADLNISSGSHRVTTKFTNARKTSKCSRNLRVDLVKVVPKPAPVPTPAPDSDPIALGIWNPGVPWDMTNHDKYVSQIGKEPAMVLWYQSWGPNSDGKFCASCAENLSDRGYTQVLTWMSKDYTRQPERDQPEYSNKTIIEGDHDAYIREYARSVANWGKPIMIRFNHEMNGDWYPWGADVNGNKPGEYVAAWKHVHDIFQQEGATNVKWVWSPNVKAPVYNDTTPFSEYYPGDAYVDWIALDGYNFGTSYSWARWYSLAEVFGPSYKEITALTSKPLMIAEMGSSEAGGNKAAWIRNGLLNAIPQQFPRVKAVIYFNQDEGGVPWRLNSSSESLGAFRDVATSSTYQGQVP